MVILDIETVPDESKADYILLKKSTLVAPANYKDPEKIKANIEEQFAKLTEKASLSPRTGRVMMIGLLSDKEISPFVKVDGGLYAAQFVAVADHEEPEILKMALTVLKDVFDNSTELLVTYNGKGFDIPFMVIRCMLHGIPKPLYLPRYGELTSKYNTNSHLDLMNFFEEGGLSEWSYMFGDSNTFSSDGGQILQNFKAGNMEWILSKNLDDLYKTYYLAQRVLQWQN